MSLRDRIRGLSGRSEILLTLCVAFGAVIPRSLGALLNPQNLFERAAPITDRVLSGTVAFELLLLCLLGAFLRARGWTLARLGLKPSWRDSAIGLALAVGAYAAYAGLWVITVSLWPNIGQIAGAIHLVNSDLTWLSVALVIVVNPVFEEVFECGYVIAALRESRGVTTAINVSAAIRVFCHFYQGVLGVLGVVPVALLFAYWFARTGRLWPLIVAHAILDLAGLVWHVR